MGEIKVENDSPIQEIIDINVVPKIIQLLDLTTVPKIQYEAAWCITNIATGAKEHVQCLVEKGVIAKLISLLNSQDESLIDQALWALGNVAGDTLSYRNSILAHGIIPILAKLLTETKDEEMLKNGCWLASNLARGPPYPKYETLREVIPAICRILKANNAPEILIDCCSALTSLGETCVDKAEIFLSNDIVPRLVQLVR